MRRPRAASKRTRAVLAGKGECIVELTAYQWLMLAITVVGILGTWVVGAFMLGRAVEQMKATIKKEIESERDKIIARVDAMEDRFAAEQRTQDHNFGEVGLAMREKIAQVEKHVREVEIWGRDHFVLKSDFINATEAIRSDIKELASDIKTDLRELSAKIARN